MIDSKVEENFQAKQVNTASDEPSLDSERPDTASAKVDGDLNMSRFGGYTNYEGWQRLSEEEWSAQFDKFSTSMFRLETLQVYTEEEEAEMFARFRAGEAIPAEWMNGWCDLICSKAESGATVSRVHLVSLPLTEYLRFEIEHGYRHSLKAGEKIFLSDLSELPADHELIEDFFIFDDSTVVINIYNEVGTFQGAVMNQDPVVVARYVRLREEAINRAEPVEQFYKRIAGVDLQP